MPQQDMRGKISSSPSVDLNINLEVLEFFYLGNTSSHKLKLNTCKILCVDSDLWIK